MINGPFTNLSTTGQPLLYGSVVLPNGTGITVTQSGQNITHNLNTALPNGETATTQAAGDNTTKVATDAFVHTEVANAIAGVNPAVAVQAATTSASDTSGFTYNNGVSGIGAFFTGSVNTAVTIDGYLFTTLGQRLLVKNDTQSPSGAFNGVYYVTQIQTVLLPPIFTRTLDFDNPSNINNTGTIPVVNGTVNGQTTWAVTSQVATVGTDPITFTEFSLNPTTLVTLTGSQALTNKDMTSGTNTWPTFNQNTTGSAAKLTTARTIGGVSFDGTANITVASATSGFTISGGNTSINNSDGASTVNIGTGTTTGTVTIGGSADQTIAIGDGGSNKVITLGSITGTSSVTIASGSGNITLNANTSVSRITVTSTGVGIGTTSPITQLHVKGSIPAGGAGTVATGANPFAVYTQDVYAYVVTGVPKLEIFDITTTSAPVALGTVTCGSAPKKVFVLGRYAYVTSAGSGLEIFDISKPSTPVSIGSVANTAYWSVHVQGRYAYTVGSDLFKVFDVSNPAAPVQVSSTATDSQSEPNIFVHGKYAYINNFNASSLQIFDISDPTSPTNVSGSVSMNSGTYESYVQGRYLYNVAYSGNTLRIYDISNPVSVPAFVGTLTVAGGAPLGIQVQGRYAYIVNQTGSTLQFVDVSDPTTPVSVGTVSISSARRVSVSGRFACTVGESSALLNVIDLGGGYVQQFEAGGIETGVLNVHNKISAFSGSFQGGLSIGDTLEVKGNVGFGGNVNFITGEVLSWGAANVVMTHSSGILTIGTGEMRITTVGTNSASVVTVGGTQTLTNKTLTTRTFWGQNFDATANVSGSLTAVGDITGGASSMIIQAGTGNSRILTLKSTTSGGTATAFLTGNADQSSTFGGNISGTGAWSITGGAGNMTIVSGTGASRTMILQTTTSGSTATTFLTGNADQTTTFASTIFGTSSSNLGSGATPFGSVFLGSAGVVNINNGSSTLTGGTNTLTVGGSGANGNSLNLAAGGTSLAPLLFASGTNLTTAIAGAIEFDGVNYYATIDSTSKRGAVPVEQYFHLTADGGTISTIGNFFGSTSNISLVSGGYYEIEIWLYYLNSTAGTVTWTLTNSAAPTSQNIYFSMSPITGVVAPPGTATELAGQYVKDATAARAFTTGTLTDAVNHYAYFKIFLQNATGTSLKIQATKNVGGTITPRLNSWWRAIRRSPNNIGTFAA